MDNWLVVVLPTVTLILGWALSILQEFFKGKQREKTEQRLGAHNMVMQIRHGYYEELVTKAQIVIQSINMLKEHTKRHELSPTASKREFDRHNNELVTSMNNAVHDYEVTLEKIRPFVDNAVYMAGLNMLDAFGLEFWRIFITLELTDRHHERMRDIHNNILSASMSLSDSIANDYKKALAGQLWE